MSDLRIPDRFSDEPVIGWRTWLADEGGALWSPRTTPDALWQPGSPFEARCWVTEKPLHPAPDLACGHCGVHAWKEPLLAALSFDMGKALMEDGFVPVYGQVSLWGRVLEHEDGWRGQLAYPYSMRTSDEEVAKRLYQTYGIETEVI